MALEFNRLSSFAPASTLAANTALPDSSTFNQSKTKASAQSAFSAALVARQVTLTTAQRDSLKAFAAVLQTLNTSGSPEPSQLQALLHKHGVSAEIVLVDDLKSSDGQKLSGFAANGKIYLDSGLSGAAWKEVLIEELAETFYQSEIGGFSKGDFGAEVAARMRGEPVGKGSANPYLAQSANDVTTVVTPDGEIVTGEAHNYRAFEGIISKHENVTKVIRVYGNPGKAAGRWMPDTDAQYHKVQTRKIEVDGKDVDLEGWAKKGSNFRADANPSTILKRLTIVETDAAGKEVVTHYIPRPERWVKQRFGNVEIPHQHRVQVFAEHQNLNQMIDIRTYDPPRLQAAEPTGTAAAGKSEVQPGSPGSSASADPQLPDEDVVNSYLNSLRPSDRLTRLQNAVRYLKENAANNPEDLKLWNALVDAIDAKDTKAITRVLRLVDDRVAGSDASTAVIKPRDAKLVDDHISSLSRKEGGGSTAKDAVKYLKENAEHNPTDLDLWNKLVKGVREGNSRAVNEALNTAYHRYTASTAAPTDTYHSGARYRKLTPQEADAAVDSYVRSIPEPEVRSTAERVVQFLRDNKPTSKRWSSVWDDLVKALQREQTPVADAIIETTNKTLDRIEARKAARPAQDPQSDLKQDDIDVVDEYVEAIGKKDARATARSTVDFLQNNATSDSDVLDVWNKLVKAIKANNPDDIAAQMDKAKELKAKAEGAGGSSKASEGTAKPEGRKAGSRRNSGSDGSRASSSGGTSDAETLAKVEAYPNSFADPARRNLAREAIDFLRDHANNDPVVGQTWNELVDAIANGDADLIRKLIGRGYGFSARYAREGLYPGNPGEIRVNPIEVVFDNSSAAAGKLPASDAYRIAGTMADASGEDVTLRDIIAQAKQLQDSYAKTAQRMRDSIWTSHDQPIKMSISTELEGAHSFDGVKVSPEVLSGLEAAEESLVLDVIEEAVLGEVGMAVMFNPVAFTLAGFLADKAMRAVAEGIGRQEHTIDHFFMKHMGFRVFDAEAENIPAALQDLLTASGALTSDGHIQEGNNISADSIASILNSETNSFLTLNLRLEPYDNARQASFHMLALALQNGGSLRTRDSGEKLARLLLKLKGERAFTGYAISNNAAREGVMDFVEWYLGAPGTHPDLQRGFASVMAEGGTYERFLKKAKDETVNGGRQNMGSGGTYVGGNLHNLMVQAFRNRNKDLPGITPQTSQIRNYG